VKPHALIARLPAALFLGALLPALAQRASNASSSHDPLPVPVVASPHPLSTMAAPAKVSPFLWFRRDAEAALEFYASVFPDAKVADEMRWGEGGPEPKGTLMAASITFGGQRFMVLNGGAAPEFNDSFSIYVRAETQAEIDDLWAKLCAGGGAPGPCGWLKDKFGVAWQVVPSRLLVMLGDADPAKAQRVGAAMMQMQKLDLARLEAAYAGR
jgi:predicted 3-demethylubiquinone-9 3-methyltransferase (glyoxalase superfamily)